MKIHNRIDIIRYLEEHDHTYRVEDNVIFAPKAFIVNSIIQWCYYSLDIKRMQPNEMDFYLQSLSSFLEDKSDIYWDEDDNLVIS
tara:strand:+ start:43 stop:297 length:255 start_codon:yes stop_codon:yes gene_type:complete